MQLKPSGKLILAGDIGGTKTLLQVAEVAGDRVRVLGEQRFESAAFTGLVPMVQTFLQSFSGSDIPLHAIQSACFGVAGPVNGRQADLTNLPWKLDADEMVRTCGIPHVTLINDFAAIGYGIAALEPQDCVTLQPGKPVAQGVRVILGAGTGLGVCFLIWSGDHYQVVSSEGGHMDFAPADELQAGLLHYLRPSLGHVSCERIVSGSGLVAIYQYLREQTAGAEAPALQRAMQEGDPAAAISECALAGQDMVAASALTMFVRIYGAQAGNLALALLARGGVYVAGGIAPKIMAEMRAGGFMQAFLDKGRYREMLADFPVQVIVNEKVGLMGAALVASRLAS